MGPTRPSDAQVEVLECPLQGDLLGRTSQSGYLAGLLLSLLLKQIIKELQITNWFISCKIYSRGFETIIQCNINLGHKRKQIQGSNLNITKSYLQTQKTNIWMFVNIQMLRDIIIQNSSDIKKERLISLAQAGPRLQTIDRLISLQYSKAPFFAGIFFSVFLLKSVLFAGF